MPTFWRVFIINPCWILSKAFPASIQMIIRFSLFNLSTWWITRIGLWILKNPWIPVINPTWSWYVILLVHCWIWLASILLRIFASVFINYLLFSCSVMSNSLQLTPWNAASQASLSITVSQSLFRLMFWVDDAIQPSHPPLSPSPFALSLSRHQGLFQWVGSSHQVAKALELQLQHQSFQWIFRTGLLWIDWFGLLAVQGTQQSSPTPQFKSINSSALGFLYSPTLTSIHDYWKNHNLN